MNLLDTNQMIEDAYNHIKSKINFSPEIGVVLGSGLGEMISKMTDKIIIPYHEIPHFANSTAPGHIGQLVCGTLSGKKIIAMQGRLHVYEGHNPIVATLLIRVMKLFNVHTLIITCASGGLNVSYKAGDIMLILDHINFSGTNPLLGKNLENFGPRFPVMFDVYTPELVSMAHKIATDNNIKLQQGIYVGILGPTYATRAELSFFINNHCDAIGMSVVHEAIVAAHSGIKVLGLAAITDMALPYDDHHHATENDIIESAKNIQSKFQILLSKIIEQMHS